MVNSDYILVLGASIDQLFLIKTAHEMGLGTVVLDGNANAPGLKMANYSAPIDFSNIKKVIYFVEECLNQGIHIQGLTTMGSDVPHIIAKIADHFCWPGPSIETALLATDKFLMKQHFQKTGIPVPRFSLVDSKEAVSKQWQHWRCEKLITKPTNQAGSRGVSIIRNASDIGKAVKTAQSYSKNDQILIEEYIEGPQISTESILWDDQVLTPGFADRVYDGMDVFWPQIMENGGWVPSLHKPDIIDKVRLLVEEAARSLGIVRGVAKGDVVLHPVRGPVIIEIAARLSGGDFCESLVPFSSGVNYVKSVINMAMGKQPDWSELKPTIKQTVANRYFFLPQGKLESISGIKKAKSLSGLKKIKFFIQPGDVIPKMASHGQRVGVFIVSGNSRKDVQEKIDNIYQSVVFKVDQKLITGKPHSIRS